VEVEVIKLAKLAKDLNVTVVTLYNWHKQGKIEFVKLPNGRINYVTNETYNEFLGIKEKKEEKVVIYCRVSSTTNKTNLKTQRDRMVNYCMNRGYIIHNIICEFGSGINDNRVKLTKLLGDGDFTKIVVEHKDRLTRIGFNYLKILLEKEGKQIEVVNNADDNREDLIQDFVSIITSYCAKIYGQRRSKRKTEKLIKELFIIQ